MGQRDEAALRGLVGAGPSRVGVEGAMRARDVSRPSEADLEAAVESLVVRRAWRNREPGDNPAPPVSASTPPSPPAAIEPEQGELELSVEPREEKPAPQLHHRNKQRHKKRR